MPAPLFYFRLVVMATMTVLFLVEAHKAWSSWREARTSVVESVVPVDTLLYPSLSVCKRYTYDTFLDPLLLNSSSLEEARGVVEGRVWGREQVVRFLGHPSILNLTFPCMTNQDGTDPGKPCSFPDEGNRTGCHLYGTLTPACYTRSPPPPPAQGPG